jgi:repressor LexA
MNRLKELRTKRGLKQTELAKVLNITQGALSGWENERYSIGNNELRNIADFFGVSTDYLLGRDIDPPQINNFIERPVESRKIPVMGSVKCGINGLAFEYVDGNVFIGKEAYGEYFALVCRGDSMSGVGISDGDIAIVRRQDTVQTGEIAVVIVDGDEGTLKRVRFQNNAIILEAANPFYPPRLFVGEEMNSLKFVGRVIEIRKRF